MLAQADRGGPIFGSVFGIRTFSDPGPNLNPGTEVFPAATTPVAALANVTILTRTINLSAFGWPGSDRQLLIECEMGCDNAAGANAGNGSFVLEIDGDGGGGGGFSTLRSYSVIGEIPAGAATGALYIFKTSIITDRGLITAIDPVIQVRAVGLANASFDVLANQSRLTVWEIS